MLTIRRCVIAIVPGGQRTQVSAIALKDACARLRFRLLLGGFGRGECLLAEDGWPILVERFLVANDAAR